MLIDPLEYVQTPRFTVAAGLALVRSLIAALPRDATGAMSSAAVAMRDQGLELQRAWIASEQKPSTTDPRPVDQQTDSVWRGIYFLAQGAIESGIDETKAAAAEQLLRELYAGGLVFTNRRYREQWAEMAKRLEKLQEPKLAQALALVAGDAALTTLQRQQEAYGAAIGVTARQDPRTPSPNLIDERAALSDKVTVYCLAVLAAYPIETEQGAATVRHVLAPIEELRSSHQSKGAPREEDPEQPLPPLTTTP